MMQKCRDDKVLRAIVNLTRAERVNFSAFTDWLRLLRESALEESAVRKDDVESRWLQGEARAIKNILDTITESESRLEKMQNGTTSGTIR